MRASRRARTGRPEAPRRRTGGECGRTHVHLRSSSMRSCIANDELDAGALPDLLC